MRYYRLFHAKRAKEAKAIPFAALLPLRALRETPLILMFGIILITGCTRNEKLFESLAAAQTGIHFINHNEDTDSLSILDYLYYYNGGGVAVGDINNDALPDIYFTANQGGNKLYLNKGNFQFEDITASAGVSGKADWTTGVTMADVNGDGLLDIYVSVVTDHKTDFGTGTPVVFFPNGNNQLFINNGNNTFTESSHEYGLALKGYNTQAAFFDYDRDGDLDLYQLQHSIHKTDTYGDTSLRRKNNAVSGGKLYRNDNNKFIDATASAGIFSSALGYGLGIAIADFNNDGWPDIYIGNDFHESDYYYLNQHNGSFLESGASAFGHTSFFSMGNDVADINHDGWLDVFTLDMLPADEKILKSSIADEAFDTYTNQRSLGYSYQYARNCLQLNTGQGKYFSEIGLYADVAATDWSWSALMADYDLDGQTDIFVTNGIKSRLNDLDYVKFISGEEVRKNSAGNKSYDKEMLKRQPPGKWHNYIFSGTDSLRFIDRSVEWGFDKATLSHGAAYADLDADGDLDLVVNNMNAKAEIYRNQSRERDTSRHFISFTIGGYEKNSKAVGARCRIKVNGTWYTQEVQATRGFISAVDTKLYFGLGNAHIVDSAVITWPDSSQRVLLNLSADLHSVISYRKAVEPAFEFPSSPQNPIVEIIPDAGIDFIHKENHSFSDFNRQWFIPHQLSTAGPAAATGDVNGDGLDDVFIGGAKLQPSLLYLQQPKGTFVKNIQSGIANDSACEDVDAIFFDADGDNDNDLYVVSGGNEYFDKMPQMKDRLYINDGKGNFKKSHQLPDLFENKSVVAPADFDGDGDIDLFVGGRADSKVYGIIPASFLLVNDGKGNFTVQTDALAPGLSKIGMVTAAAWGDIDQDADPDLVIVGEWMAPAFFVNNNGKLQREKSTAIPSGWYQSLAMMDANGDGNPDLLLGNYGLNSKLTPRDRFPLRMYLGDFDKNNTPDQLLAVSRNGQYYPFLGKELLEKQLPYLKKDYLQYSTMAGKTVGEVFNNRLDDASVFEAKDFSSSLLLNIGNSEFTSVRLPAPLQWAPLFAFLPGDFNDDGKQDFIAGGNFYGVIPYEGRYDAMPPAVCFGNGKGEFQTIPLFHSPVVMGEVRRILNIRLADNRKGVWVFRNNDRPLLFAFKKQDSTHRTLQ